MEVSNDADSVSSIGISIRTNKDAVSGGSTGGSSSISSGSGTKDSQTVETTRLPQSKLGMSVISSSGGSAGGTSGGKSGGSTGGSTGGVSGGSTGGVSGGSVGGSSKINGSPKKRGVNVQLRLDTVTPHAGTQCPSVTVLNVGLSTSSLASSRTQTCNNKFYKPPVLLVTL